MNREQEKLVVDNLKFAYFMANKFTNTGIEYEELVSISKLGLVKAASKYDESKGVKFTSFAYKLISNEILMEVRKRKTHIQPLSLYSILEDGADEVLMVDEDDHYEDFDNIDLLHKAFKLLNEKEKEIIYLYYFEDKIEQEIANKLGYSRSYVSRIKNSAIKKMRKYFEKSTGGNYNE